jgi:hypothetical protein
MMDKECNLVSLSNGLLGLRPAIQRRDHTEAVDQANENNAKQNLNSPEVTTR